MKSAFKLIILGAPGSGKGTISSRISKDFGLKHVSSGDLLRNQIASNSDLGKKAQELIAAGQLVPDDLICGLVLGELNNFRSWLLDGFPRTRYQAEYLHSCNPANIAINLDVPHSVIIDRIKGRWIHVSSGRIYHDEYNPPRKKGFDDLTSEPLIQREDDKPEAVLKRLQVYEKTVSPVLEFYHDINILQQFHGTESNVIYPKVQAFLRKCIPSPSV